MCIRDRPKEKLKDCLRIMNELTNINIPSGTCHFHCRSSSLKAILICKFVHDPQAILKFLFRLCIHVCTQGIRGFLSESTVSPCSRVFHKDSKSRRIITDIAPVVAKYTFMCGNDLSSFGKDIDCVGMNSNQYLLIGIFRSC